MSNLSEIVFFIQINSSDNSVIKSVSKLIRKSSKAINFPIIPRARLNEAERHKRPENIDARIKDWIARKASRSSEYYEDFNFRHFPWILDFY